MTEQKLPEIGDAVKVVTSTYVETYALVTAVHGVGYQTDDVFHMPSINCVYVSPDAAKSDTYGRQIERDLCSLQHFAEGPNKMPRPGRYYELLVQRLNPKRVLYLNGAGKWRAKTFVSGT